MRGILSLAVVTVATVAVTLVGACAAPAATPAPTAKPVAAAAAPAQVQATPIPEIKWVGGKLQPLPDGFPRETIRFLVYQKPGDSQDTYQRAIAEAIKPLSPVDIVVENRDDPRQAFGMMEYAASQRGGKEGYFITSFNTGTIGRAYVQGIGDPKKDLSPIIATHSQPFTLVVKADSPFKGLKDAIEFAKGNPGKLKIVGSSPGSTSHLVPVMFAQEAKLDITYIPGNQITDLLGGGAQVSSGILRQFPSYIKSGDVRWLVASSEKRWSGLEDVPTFKELGFNVVMVSLDGLSTSPEAPQSHVQWLYTLMKRGIEEAPGFQKYLQSVQAPLDILDPKAFKDWVVPTSDDTEKVVRSVGLHYEQQKKK